MSTFNAWFDETSANIEKLAAAVAVVSTLLTAYLFLQLVITGEKPMPVEQIVQRQPPNVIFIIADALSAKDMSMFGYSLPTTPNLNKITKTWTVFTNAQSPLTCTVAALPTFMSGRYGYVDNPASYGDWLVSQPGWLSLPKALEQIGYQTWWSGYLSPGYYHLGPVIKNNACRPGDSRYIFLSRTWFQVKAILKTYFPFIPISLAQDKLLDKDGIDFPCDELDDLITLLQSGKTTSPFFIYYHYRGVHGFPYPSGKHLGTFLPLSEGEISDADQRKLVGSYKPENQPKVDKLHLRYDEAIADQDARLADFFESLKQLGLYDSAMIIVTSDHGQSFENGYTTHCTPLVSNVEAHVPLLIKYPYQIQGQRFDFLVSTIDVIPTILDIANLKYPASWLDGSSLISQAEQPEKNRIVFTRKYFYGNSIPSVIAATDGKYRLIKRGEQFLLFDPNNDPLEKTNLFEQDNYGTMPEVLRLMQALENYRQRTRLLQAGAGILTLPPLIP